MLRKCHGHGFSDITQIHIFRNGHHKQYKLLLDATEGDTLMSKSSYDDIKIIKSMAVNDKKSEHSRGHHTKKSDILELETNDVLLTQRSF
jgi:hypothetical protein